MYVRRLIWDDWNEDHIARHQVDREDVEVVCRSSRSLGVRMRRGRYRVIGQTGEGRYLAVILDAVPNGGVYYAVTARNATDPERRRLLTWRR